MEFTVNITNTADMNITDDVKNYHKLLLNCTGAQIKSDDDLRKMRERTQQIFSPLKVGQTKFVTFIALFVFAIEDACQYC